MSDLEIFTSMLNRVGIDFMMEIDEDEDVHLSVPQSCPGVGYSSFAAVLMFDKDGKLIGVGGSEG